jgi:lysophospholipase L1-like esterase
MSTRFALLAAVPLVLGVGCASSGSGGSGTGGAIGTGGSATGGIVGTGGTNATGGTSATGGVVGSGGTSATGGIVGTGGHAGGNGTGGQAGGHAGGNGTGGTPLGTGGTGGGAGAKGTGGSGNGGGTGSQHWVGVWTAAQYVDSNTSNVPPISLSNSVIRQVAHVSLGGSQIRVQISNLDGNGSLAIKSAHIAMNKLATSDPEKDMNLVDSNIDTTTDKALLFSGAETVTIANGKEVWSDPIDFTLPPLGNLTITIALGSVPSTLTQHSGSRTTSYFQSGSTTVNAANMTSAKTAALWFFISAIDVMADSAARGVVAIGDSITDGRGTTTDGNNRWTDILSSRLQSTGPKNVAVMNQGIGATNLLGSSGTAAQARYAHDVLGQDGIKYVIVFEGVNDIHGGATAAQLETGYKDLVTRGRAAGLKVYGATITPFGGGSSGYYSSAAEMTREQVNTWIKTPGNFDGVIDFDAALTDGKTGNNEPAIQPALAQWSEADGLHPGPAGYKAMGEAIDLSLFAQ